MTDNKRGPVKAYRNTEFLTGPDARTVRILCEYLEPRARIRDQAIQRSITPAPPILPSAWRAGPWSAIRKVSAFTFAPAAAPASWKRRMKVRRGWIAP